MWEDEVTLSWISSMLKILPLLLSYYLCQEVSQVANGNLRFQDNVVLFGGITFPLGMKTSKAKMPKVVEKGKKNVASESLALIREEPFHCLSCDS